MLSDNELYQNQMGEMKVLLQNVQSELEELKNKA
jgi:hypothetical protein